MNDETPHVTIYGTQGSAAAYKLRDFLQRSEVPFEWVPLATDADARDRAGVDGLGDKRLPACVFADGERLEAPTLRRVIEKLGWFRDPSRSQYDLAIYGAGPAGLSAAVYGASEGLKTVVIERSAIGGQAGTSSRIENYLGFPKGVAGAELAERAREQACRFGAEILLAREAVEADFSQGIGAAMLADGTRIAARTSICATGVRYRRLGLPEEDRYLGAGVFYGAGSSEASSCNDEDVLIVGGGNSAGQAALHFSGFAASVRIVIRGKSLKDTLSQYLLDRILTSPKIEVVTETEVVHLAGETTLSEVTLRHRASGEETAVPTRWLFVCIGGEPHTQWADAVGVLRDKAGYLLTGPDLLQDGKEPKHWPLQRAPYYLETSVPGIFAAGDVRHGSVKRCASAVGEGAMAVTFVHRYLADV